jgi:Family of unknown function (DUF5331)
MNTQQLRQSLKVKWLTYYQKNRPWVVRMRLWGTYDGQRRPASSFILGVLSTIEPQLTETFPFILDLSKNPDRIIAALGLNFNPDAELNLFIRSLTNGKAVKDQVTTPASVMNGTNGKSAPPEREVTVVKEGVASHASTLPSWMDESCEGRGYEQPQPVIIQDDSATNLEYPVPSASLSHASQQNNSEVTVQVHL